MNLVFIFQQGFFWGGGSNERFVRQLSVRVDVEVSKKDLF